MPTILNILKDFNTGSSSDKLEFIVEGIVVGHIPSIIVPHLISPIFTIQNNAVHLTSFNSLNQRTIELEKVLLEWKSKRLFRCLDGWRNERYFIYGPNGPLLEIERAATGLFGVLSLGCQLNGYTIVNNEIKMWIGKRSLSKQTYPGMLDNTVGGGLTAGSIPLQTLIKECYEEAGIEEHLASKSKYVGYISYWQEKEFESNSGIDYIFDLQLPESFIPKPVDLEVDSFQLVSMTDLKELILQNKFHPEALMVVVDFLIRHHAISDIDGELEKLLRFSLPYHRPVFE